MVLNDRQVDGWNEWGRYVLEELKRLNTNLEKSNKELSDLKLEVNTLKIKAGLIGGIAGASPSILIFLYNLLKNN